jgi:hypothetical protein
MEVRPGYWARPHHGAGPAFGYGRRSVPSVLSLPYGTREDPPPSEFDLVWVAVRNRMTGPRVMRRRMMHRGTVPRMTLGGS